MTPSLDESLIPAMNRMIAALNEYDPVTQQKLIELLAARHALKMEESADFVAASMNKHIWQLIHQIR